MKIEFAPGKTYFGLEIHFQNLIKQADIMALPFAEFWQESAMGSTMPIVEDETYVYLHDWANFCERFVRTGTHRFQD